MATKAKVTSKAKPKVKPAAKAAKKSPAAKASPKKTSAPKTAEKKKAAAARPETKPAALREKPVSAPVQKMEKAAAPLKPAALVVKSVVNTAVERRRPLKKPIAQRNVQFNFMKAPGAEYEFEVGDIVEVFCDHEKNRDRIRGWVKGIIVQVDHKLAAVQFRSNVYLTDGWMVPDRILWFPVNSEHIRPVAGKKSAEKKDAIPDY